MAVEGFEGSVGSLFEQCEWDARLLQEVIAVSRHLPSRALGHFVVASPGTLQNRGRVIVVHRRHVHCLQTVPNYVHFRVA
eukprot:8496728-Pyramimonas_sp.AAC.1